MSYKSKFKKLEDETKLSGSIIYWSQRNPEFDKTQKIPVKCGSCLEIRIISISRKKGWDAICYKCRTLSGSNHPLWKNGKTLSKEGYIYIHKTLIDINQQELFKYMFTKNGYCLEHRIVMANYLNRPLSKDEKVHHINEIKDDNRIENLELTNSSDHAAHHFAQVKSLNSEINYLKSLLNLNNINY